MRAGSPRTRIGRALAALFLLLVYGFLLAPLIVVIVSSVSPSPAFPPNQFGSISGRWFSELFANAEFTGALITSAQVALAAAGIATIVSVPIALALVRGRVPARAFIEGFFMAPLLIPQIALSLALLQVIVLAGLPLSIMGLVLAHSVLVLPFVLRGIVANLMGVGVAVEEAAASLGASPWAVVSRITLPLIRPGTVAGFVLAFIISFINVPVSLFLVPIGEETMPVTMLVYMQTHLTPILAAASTLVVVVALALGFLLDRVFRVRLFM